MGRITAENKHTGKLYPVDSKAIYRVIYEVVDVLPTENIKTSVIYCVPIIGKENEYDMFLYINGDWVSVGSGSIDLSDYYTKEETADLLSDKMDLAPLNPTAEQIAALPVGQVYGDTANHKGTIKGGQEFYDTEYVDNNYRKTIINSQFRPPCNTQNHQTDYKVGDTWITTTTNSVRLYKLAQTTYSDFNGYTHYWVAETPTLHYISRSASLPTQIVPERVNYGDSHYYYEQPQYSMGDYICRRDSNMQTIALYICVSAKIQQLGTSCVVNYKWEEVSIPYNTYTKTEINTMIGDIGTALDTLNNNLAEV